MVKKTPGAILPSDRKHREFHLLFSSERDQNPACSSLFTDWSESRFCRLDTGAPCRISAVGFPESAPEPDLHLSAYPALHWYIL